MFTEIYLEIHRDIPRDRQRYLEIHSDIPRDSPRYT